MSTETKPLVSDEQINGGDIMLYNKQRGMMEVVAFAQKMTPERVRDIYERDRSSLIAEREELKRVSQMLVDVLDRATPAGPDWWCPTCQEALGGNRVTFQECCDTCGTHLGYQSEAWIIQSNAALAAAKELNVTPTEDE